MRISGLATQSRKRLADKRLVDTSIVQRMPDEAIIDAYIACADCGKRQVDDAAVLARFVEEAGAEDVGIGDRGGVLMAHLVLLADSRQVAGIRAVVADIPVDAAEYGIAVGEVMVAADCGIVAGVVGTQL